MQEKVVIRKLKKDAKEKVTYDNEKKEAVIAMVLEQNAPVQKKGSFREFLFSQIGFTGKIAFFWQAVWVLCFFYAVWKGAVFHITNEGLCILSMAPPLLLLLTVEDVSRIYNRSMLEIEYATKYSLKTVVMARMFISSVVNGAILAAGMAYAKGWMGLALSETLAYGLTPLLLMTFALLVVMEKWSGEQLKYAGISIYLLFALAIFSTGSGRMNIYRRSFLWIWGLLAVLGMAAVAYQFQNFRKHLDSFELLAEG